MQKQQDALRDAELRQYQVGKYGFMNFVSAGLLVGDRIQKGKGSASDDKDSAKADSGSVGKKDRKRKAAEEDVAERLTGKKRKIRGAAGGQDLPQGPTTGKENFEPVGVNQESDVVSEDRVKKVSKKRRKSTKDDDPPIKPITSSEKQRLKEEKRARKEERRKRKEARRLKKEAKRKAAATKEVVQEARPAAQSIHGGRHAVRHRYIQQKRMAGMDAQAMNEIFMIKAAA